MSTKTNGPEQSVYNRIVATYRENGSVKETAERVGVSEVTARRVLITEGLWSSKTSKRVGELLQRGKTAKEIAAEMSVSRSAVEAYLPYSRGMYGNSDTENARNSKEYRERKNKAREGVSMLTGSAEKKIGETGNRPDARSKPVPKKNVAGSPSNQPEDVVVKLHLELAGSCLFGADADAGPSLSDKVRKKRLSLAKAKEGISRDIIVPGDMTLHALHYAIQKLFGWQNSHLHRFYLPDEAFEKLTDGRLGFYTDLCGTLFRFPVGELSAYYWDDDYEESISAKSWLKKKYTAPFRRGAVGDTYMGNRFYVQDFWDRCPEFGDDTPLIDVLRQIMFEEDFNCLIEHRTVGELFLPKTSGRTDILKWRDQTLEEVEKLDREIAGSGEDLDDIRSNIKELNEWRDSADWLSQVKWRYPDTYRKEVRKELGTSYEDACANHKRMIAAWTGMCRKIFYDWNVSPDPCFPEIGYHYDYGDNWRVRITAVERQNDQLAYEALNGRPVCVHADGLNVVDDCGGIYGYWDLLETIKGPDREEAEEMKEWAGSLGWTGKMSRPDKML